ncbi:MAG: methyltransferase domain-containing protein [Eubacterium sp.]|jgi:Methylase involved in ubiquinone/menaquinone biosynthesis|nr:methyltransferase domain-containing protein [Eubacterium sp.]
MMNRIFRPGGLALTETAAKAASLSTDTPILDIGCGTGSSLKHLHQIYGCPITGIDLSATCIASAKKSVPEGTFLQADASALPFADASFTAVFLECVLCLTEHPLTALTEASRVLTSGGTIIISTLSRLQGASLLEEGCVCLNHLSSALIERNFTDIQITDRKQDLIQFCADAIFCYGSISAYIEHASRTLGGAVVSCNISPKKTGYHLITAKNR